MVVGELETEVDREVSPILFCYYALFSLARPLYMVIHEKSSLLNILVSRANGPEIRTCVETL